MGTTTNTPPMVAGALVITLREDDGTVSIDLPQGAIDIDPGYQAALRVAIVTPLPAGFVWGRTSPRCSRRRTPPSSSCRPRARSCRSPSAV